MSDPSPSTSAQSVSTASRDSRPGSIDGRPRWARRKDARPQELLSAALDLFVERGFAATRLDDVAAAAGVSKGTVYLYFSSKEELFKAVVREHLVPVLVEAGNTIEAFTGSSADLFRRLVIGWWNVMGDPRLSGLAKLIMSESGNFPDIARFYHEEVIARADALMHAILQRGMERGEFERRNAAELTRVCIAPMVFLMMWTHSFGPCSRDNVDPVTYLDTFMDMALNGLLIRKA